MDQQRDAQLLAIGHQCAEESCLLVDFLPFKCRHCSLQFCGEHFGVSQHKCPKYDETKHNRVAPSCPLCNTPVAIPAGEDPKIRMERHINSQCLVMTGRSGHLKTGPVCARKKCGKVLFAPIRCDKCSRQFCASHRFPQDHECIGSTPNAGGASIPRGSAPISIKISQKRTEQQSVASTSNKSPSARQFLSPAILASPAAAPSASTLPPKLASSSANLFSKTDRRARAERESRRRAMMERSKKGLLTDEEKLILANEEAERAQQMGQKNKDCVLM